MDVSTFHLAFLLPALMGLFAQVGGVQEPAIGRISSIVIAVGGCATTLRLLATDTDPALLAIRVGQQAAQTP